MARYTIEDLSNKLEISTSSVQELKAKLSLRGIIEKEEDFAQMKKIVDGIKKCYGKVTLATINEYYRLNERRSKHGKRV